MDKDQALAPSPTRPISQIVIGPRFRQHLGDLDGLAHSIAELGLLHPVVVTDDGQLIAGRRRLEACRRLGWTEVPVTVLPLTDLARGEYDENVVRQDFLPSEIAAIATALRPVEAQAAKERMAAGGRLGSQGKETFLTLETGQARDHLAAYAGVSGRSLEKILAVVDAAQREPERFASLVEEMDRTGKVDGAYRTLRQRQDEQRRLMLQPVQGTYRTIVVDPPWDYEDLSLAGRGRPEYAVMSHDALLHLPVRSWADEVCHLYLWTTNNFLPRAVELVAAWGFEYKTLLTWVKPHIGLGSYFRNSTEQCLFAVRGELTTRAKDIPTHFEAPIRRHSEKPQVFFDLVERASYPPYLEVFARQERPAWTVWGSGVACETL